MIKKYHSTIDEAVDAQVRVAEQLGQLRIAKWIGLIFAPVIFIALYFLLDHIFARIVVGGSSAILICFYHFSNYKNSIRKRLRKMIIKMQGTDQPVACEYEIDDDGLSFRKLDQEVKFKWKSIDYILESDDYLELFMRPAGIAIIPKRIFDTEDELKEWAEWIKRNTQENIPGQSEKDPTSGFMSNSRGPRCGPLE